MEETLNAIPIFNFHNHVIGGTEYQAKSFHEKILPDAPNFQNYLCMILPGKNLDNEGVKNWFWFLNGCSCEIV